MDQLQSVVERARRRGPSREQLAAAARATASGVEIGAGRFGYEPVRELRNDRKFSIYERMETDPHILAGLRARKTPLMRSDCTLVAASDKPRDMRIRNFNAANLLREADDEFGREFWLRTPFKAQRLREQLHCLNVGFAAFRKSKRVVAGKHRVFDRLQWLEPATINGFKPWDLDSNDNIRALNRLYLDPDTGGFRQESIPAEELALYVHDLKGARYEGRAFLRSLYGAWLRKDFFLRMAAIWAQKVGSPVPVAFYPHTLMGNEVELEKLYDFLRQMRGQSPEYAWGAFPMSADGKPWDIKYLGASEGELDRMRGLIRGENEEIAHGADITSDMLGETQSGARALGETKQDREIQGAQELAEVLSEQEQNGVANLQGLIVEQTDDNFPGTREYPRMVYSKIDPESGLAHIDKLILAWNARIVPHVPEVRRQICEAGFGLDLEEEDYDVEEEPPMLPGQRQLPGQTARVVPDEDEDEDEDEPERQSARQPRESREQVRQRIAGLLAPTREAAPNGGRFRGPNRLETEVVSLAAVQDTMRRGEQDVLTVLRAARRAMHAQLLGRLRAGKLDATDIDGLKFSGRKAAKAQLRKVLAEVGLTGASHVRSELAKQRGPS